jgi:succinoglycan biosynthesis protein ExoA
VTDPPDRNPAAANVSVVASVLVPVRNEEGHLHHTIAGIQGQRFDAPVEFLFVEGRSDDATRALLEDLTRPDPRMRVLDNPGRTVPSALNVGLRHARGRFVARMDAHTHYPPEYLSQGIERLRRGDVQWVSGPQLPYGAGRWSRRVALALDSWLGTGGAAFRRVTGHEVDVHSGFTGVWLRETLESLGGWDEDWAVNEDAELAARILENGGRIVCLPQLAARYVPRNSLAALFEQYRRYGYYRAKTSRRHPETMRPSHLLAPGLALATAASVLGPRPARGVSRLGLALYAVGVGGTSVRWARHGHPRDAAALPAVFLVMHLAWGLGFLAGCVRFGLPLRALARFLGLSRPGWPR